MWKIMVADHKNQAPHRNEVSQNALLENCICFIFRQMTFLRQKLAENRRDEAKRILQERPLYHPYFPHDIYINVSGIKEWLNQPHKHYAEKNEALLQLPDLLLSSEYLGSEPDPKGRDYIIASHLFKTQIADDTSWIIVNETIWNECWVHSISDNIPDIKEEQDF